MNLDNTVKELIVELLKCSVEELKKIKVEWIRELEKMQMKPEVRFFCSRLVDAVIKQKGGSAV